MLIKRFFVLGMILALINGCVSDDRGEAGNLTLALQESVDHSILPAVEGFQAASVSFDSAVNAFCNAKDEHSLLALQQEWQVLFKRWYRLSIYNFGPLDDDLVFPVYTFVDSLRLRGTDYTETIRGEITNDIAGVHVLDDAYFSGKTFQKVGLLALESAVFETAASEHSKSSADILAEYQLAIRKCDLLKGLSSQISKHASYVSNGWNSTHKNSSEPYRVLFLTNQLDDGTAPMIKLIASVQEFLDYLQKRSVVNVAGQISGHSWQAISVSIDEIEQLLKGGVQTTESFFEVMTLTGNQASVDTVNATIAAIRQAIEDKDAAMLDITLGLLDGHFKRDIPDSLEITLGINFTDGD